MINFDDLSAFDAVTPANEGRWLTLLDANDRPTDKQLKLLGSNSEVWRNDNYNDSDMRQRALAKSGKPYNPTTKETEEIVRKRVAKVTPEWRGFKQPDGSDAPCTRENVYAVLSHPKVGLSILNQALDFILNPVNYGEEGEKEASPLDPVNRMAEVAGNSNAGQSTNTASALPSGNE